MFVFSVFFFCYHRRNRLVSAHCRYLLEPNAVIRAMSLTPLLCCGLTPTPHSYSSTLILSVVIVFWKLLFFNFGAKPLPLSGGGGIATSWCWKSDTYINTKDEKIQRTASKLRANEHRRGKERNVLLVKYEVTRPSL